MPIPKPEPGEGKKEFISRCSEREYGNLKGKDKHSDKSDEKLSKMANAICQKQWREKKK